MILRCEHCHKSYKTQRGLDNHKCKVLTRLKELDTSQGRLAFHYFTLWMNSKLCYGVTHEQFIESNTYNTFFKFVNCVKRRNFPSLKIFIEYVNSIQLLPRYWVRDDVYTSYIRYLETKPPLELVKIHLKVLHTFSNFLNCTEGEVIHHLKINEIITLLQARNFTPWVLLNSKEFKLKIVEANEAEKVVLGAYLDFGTWKFKFAKYHKDLKIIKEIIEKLKL